jgi:ribosomal protein S4E
MSYITATGGTYVYAGQVITFKGVEYYVKKVNPKNLRIVAVKDGKNYNLPRMAKFTVDDSRTLTADERKTCGILTWSEKTAIKQETGLRNGAIVRIKQKPTTSKWQFDIMQKFVVLNDKTERFQIVPVGGTPDGSWWNVYPNNLEVVDL